MVWPSVFILYDLFCREDTECDVTLSEWRSLVHASSCVTPAEDFLDVVETQIIDCEDIDSAYSCSANDRCYWSTYSESCRLSREWLWHRLHGLLGQSSDVVCRFLSLHASSGCLDRSDPSLCRRDANCAWVQSEGKH